MITQEELNNIINEELASEGYEIDNYHFSKSKEQRVESINYELKRKEKVKIKK